MGAFDFLFGIPQARAQIAAGLGQAPGQPGNPAGPQPLAGAPPPAGAPPSGGAAAGPPTGAAPPSAPPQPPQPQAYQSPPDLIGMYMQLAQKQQASESFDRHLGLLAASSYPGRRPDIVMQGMTDPHQDPGAMFNNILQLQQHQQFMQSAPDIAKTLQAQGMNVTPQEILAMGPDSLKTMLAYGMPTEAMKNADAAATAYKPPIRTRPMRTWRTTRRTCWRRPSPTWTRQPGRGPTPCVSGGPIPTTRASLFLRK